MPTASTRDKNAAIARCFATVDVNNTDRTAISNPELYRRLARSINRDSTKAVATEILFRLPFRTKFSHSYSHCTRPPFKASNYFFFYLTLQGLSVSASALLQVGSLISWLILFPWTDRTPRQKWERQIGLPEIRWDTFYPLYTNLACIDTNFLAFTLQEFGGLL